MKRAIEFLKTTAIGGFLVLLPILLLQMMLVEVFGLLVGLATPIADLLPLAWVDAVKAPVLVAILLLLGGSFALGLLARSMLARRLGSAFESRTLKRLPLYRVLKGLASRLVEMGEGTAFQPALLCRPDGERQFAYLIEDHGDGFVTVLLPWAPTPMSGTVSIVPRERIQMLDGTLGDLTRVLSHWGVGSRELLATRPAESG